MSNKSSRQTKTNKHVNLHIRLEGDVFESLKRMSLHTNFSMALLANDIIKGYFKDKQTNGDEH